MHAPAPQQRPACAAHGGRKYPVSRHHVSVLCAGSQWHCARGRGVPGASGARAGACAPAPRRPAVPVTGYQILDARSGAKYHTAYREVNLNCIMR